MSQKYRFQLTKFKRINFSAYFIRSLGIGISLDCWGITIQLPFFVIEMFYYSNKQMIRMQRMADYFAQMANEMDEQ